MIVDDHADVRYLIRAIVEGAGAEFEVAGEASGADEALRDIDSVDPDVVVLDALMPIRDGFETAELILSRRPGQPILLCSAIVDEEVRERARAVGIAACLEKDAFDEIPAAARALADGAAH
jgi:two-component system chemotaxis response regulator CheY